MNTEEWKYIQGKLNFSRNLCVTANLFNVYNVTEKVQFMKAIVLYCYIFLLFFVLFFEKGSSIKPHPIQCKECWWRKYRHLGFLHNLYYQLKWAGISEATLAVGKWASRLPHPTEWVNSEKGTIHYNIPLSDDNNALRFNTNAFKTLMIIH